jgi:2-amino-4-hydroxy-6-hydroxymethyldihydropteridine diphosphokinase
VNEILLSIGSNVAKETNVPAAVARLATEPDITVLAVSSVLETPAVGADGQPDGRPAYHNVGLRAGTTLELQEVRMLLRTIETDMGRVRSQDKFAPRPIDLDLAYYGDPGAAETTGAGELPLDGDVLRHAHVAIPLEEVAPNWVHQDAGSTLAAIAAAFMAARRPVTTYDAEMGR